ncbi:MAG: DHHA1 domain-containing protein [Calditrichia bacterium]
MTEKLYYADPYCFEFDARVVEIRPEGKRVAVVLDRTCFYPEGGGQPADSGSLNDNPVVDVQSQGEEVVHYLSGPLKNHEVSGKLDRERRLSFMRRHTGQHLFSQSMLRTGGYETVSVHFGSSYSTIEFSAPEIKAHHIQQAELLANRIVNRNLPVKSHWVAPEELHRYAIRRPPPDVKKVRIVEIQDFDFAACGGVHVKSTGEIGLIKVTGQEKIRGNVRLFLHIGDQALKDYNCKIELLKSLSELLTSGEAEMEKRVKLLLEENRDYKREIISLQKNWMAAVAQLAEDQARKFGQVFFIKKMFEDADKRLPKTFVELVTDKPDRLAAAFAVNQDQVTWAISHSIKAGFNLNPLVRPLLPIIEGKGGGKPDMMQGGAAKPQAIPEFLHKFEQQIKTEFKNG